MSLGEHAEVMTTATSAATSTTAVDRPGLAPVIAGIRAQVERGRTPRDTALAVAEVLRERLPGPQLLTPQEREGSAEGYERHLLHAEPAFSVAAVVWRPGHITAIHDHVAWCSFVVLQGVEYETLYRDCGDHLVEIGRVANEVGCASGFAPPGDIHRVHNTGDVTAISLHVYGADLSAVGSSVRREYDLPVHAA